MTVKDLINKLQNIENQDIIVNVYDTTGYYGECDTLTILSDGLLLESNN